MTMPCSNTEAPKKWLPIDTAPKDGTEIILARGSRVTAGLWDVQPAVTDPDPDGITECWYSTDGGFSDEEPPTHWMPLPEPPKEVEGE